MCVFGVVLCASFHEVNLVWLQPLDGPPLPAGRVRDVGLLDPRLSDARGAIQWAAHDDHNQLGPVAKVLGQLPRAKAPGLVPQPDAQGADWTP
jgi:hypothetical protein